MIFNKLKINVVFATNESFIRGFKASFTHISVFKYFVDFITLKLTEHVDIRKKSLKILDRVKTSILNYGLPLLLVVSLLFREENFHPIFKDVN